jgi:predicted RNase H-like nuclease
MRVVNMMAMVIVPRRTLMPWVAGVDGCRAGWIVVFVQADASRSRKPDTQLCANFADVLELTPAPEVMAVDIPIGLLEAPQPGGRTCDHQARCLLKRRASSVFSPPSRQVLDATQYEQVRTGGVSRQAFNIMPKIRQVDRLMTPGLQDIVYEAHPELAFMALAGRPMLHNKKASAGRSERLQALACAPEAPFRRVTEMVDDSLKRFQRLQVAPDDVLDACVLARTAWRIAHAHAHRVPLNPPVDQHGLRMEIWY